METKTQPNISQQQKSSFKELLYRIFQVRANKPRSVKIVQWVVLAISILLFLFAVYLSANKDLLVFFLPVLIPLTVLFCFLYLYRYWCLVVLQIFSLYPIILLSFCLSYLIYMMYFMIPNEIFGFGRDWKLINFSDPSLSSLTNGQIYEFFKNWAIAAFFFYFFSYLVCAVLFHFLWGLPGEYKRRSLKPIS